MINARGWVVVALFTLALMSLAVARDSGQWENGDQAVRDWYRGLMQPDNPTCLAAARRMLTGAMISTSKAIRRIVGLLMIVLMVLSVVHIVRSGRRSRSRRTN
jgi:hypothetical protein